MANTQNAVDAKAVATAATDENDSDNDVVTDFLNSNCNNSNNAGGIAGDVSAAIPPPTPPTAAAAAAPASITNGGTVAAKILGTAPRVTVESQNYCIPVINAPPAVSVVPHSNNNHNHNNSINNNIANNNNNMIPTINVTPHSPASASKYNNIFDDTLSQLQSIRETVQKMKNSTSQHHQDNLANNYGLLSAAILSASLPDLTNSGNGAGGGAGGNIGMMWSAAAPQQCLLLHTDRRKSWTAVDDSNATGDCTNKSVSLSSLDSEEQETIRVTEQRRRSARNSTGGEYEGERKR